MRILLSAFGFSPFRGSECAVGWNIARELARWHEVTVITGDVKDSGFEREYPDYVKEYAPVKGLTVVYLKPTRLINVCMMFRGCGRYIILPTIFGSVWRSEKRRRFIVFVRSMLCII